MKLNLLIFFLLGVSVSASGIRGFTPIKGRERRLKTSTSSSNSKASGDKTRTVRLVLTGDGEVVDCSGGSCAKFYDNCPQKFFESFTDSGSSDSGSTSKKSSSTSSSRRVRRLTKTSSKSKSSDDADLYSITVDLKDLNNDCTWLISKTLDRAGESPSKSSSSSKKSRRE